MGCLNVGLPSLVPTLAGSLLAPELPSLTAAAMVHTAAFTASTTVCAMACIKAALSVAILSYFFAYFSWDSMFESAYFLCCLCLPS